VGACGSRTQTRTCWKITASGLIISRCSVVSLSKAVTG
jgi:hypothetical protein